MAYKNAKDYLPKELLSEVQKHIQGVLVYIPTDDSAKKVGENSREQEKNLIKEMHQYEKTTNKVLQLMK